MSIPLVAKTLCERWGGGCHRTEPKISEIEIVADEGRTQAGGGLNAGRFKIFNRVLDWITSDRTQLINITDRINEIVRKSGVRDGIVHLQSLHTTTAVFRNEWQVALLHAVKRFPRAGVASAKSCAHTGRR